jgi:hypothetical protein
MLCAKQDCPRPAWIEARTKIAHKYCGRTHALSDLKEKNAEKVLSPPHGKCHECKLPRCQDSVYFDQTNGRVHDYCCLKHAKLGQIMSMCQRSRFLRRARYSATQVCKLLNCQKPCFIEETTDLSYDFCGRSHAILFQQYEKSSKCAKPIVQFVVSKAALAAAN